MDKAILSGGLIAIGITIFAESGVLAGFFLPGDTLLFGAGVLASQGTLPLGWLMIVVIAAAILGDNVGYSIGRRVGKRLFKKQESVLFHPDQLKRAEQFYETHGGKTIILARFVPMIRTFAPIVAGAGKMSRARFMSFNVVGATLWGGGVTLLGYKLGQRMPWLEHYISSVILGVVALSMCFAAFHLLKTKRTRELLLANIKLVVRKLSLNKKVN